MPSASSLRTERAIDLQIGSSVAPDERIDDQDRDAFLPGRGRAAFVQPHHVFAIDLVHRRRRDREVFFGERTEPLGPFGQLALQVRQSRNAASGVMPQR